MPVLLMTLNAVLLGALGGVLNFAPVEIADRLGFSGMPVAGVILQVLAGALMALCVISWLMRRIVNGIFGRAVGLGNMLFNGVSAFGLLRAANANVLPTLTWPLGLATAALALGFIWLVFVGTGPREAATC